MANKVEQMRAFQAVVETGGFSRATGRIGMSRAAVSRHIIDLEDRLGVRLLNRTTRQMSLTEAGETFYEKCCRVTSNPKSGSAAIARVEDESPGLLPWEKLPSNLLSNDRCKMARGAVR